MSKVDLEKLRNEFANRVKSKASALQDIRQIVEDKLAMLQQNPQRMGYYRKYSEIIADNNREKDASPSRTRSRGSSTSPTASTQNSAGLPKRVRAGRSSGCSTC